MHACTLTRPDGPAPNISALDPSRGRILSSPWQAHDAGSISVASTSLRLWILKILDCGYAQYSAKPPLRLMPWPDHCQFYAPVFCCLVTVAFL